MGWVLRNVTRVFSTAHTKCPQESIPEAEDLPQRMGRRMPSVAVERLPHCLPDPLCNRRRGFPLKFSDSRKWVKITAHLGLPAAVPNLRCSGFISQPARHSLCL